MRWLLVLYDCTVLRFYRITSCKWDTTSFQILSLPSSRTSIRDLLITHKLLYELQIAEEDYEFGSLRFRAFMVPYSSSITRFRICVHFIHLSGMTAGTGCCGCQNPLMHKANRDSPCHLNCPIRHLRPYGVSFARGF